MPIKVLVIDDSSLMRHMLSDIINSYPDMKVIGTAQDPLVAREKIKELSPDVLTLDVEMPRMDGLTFLEKLMRLRPMPVVMVSSLTEANAEITLHALELGAVDFVTKPKSDMAGSMVEYAHILADKIRAAAMAGSKSPRIQDKKAALPTETHFFSPALAKRKVIVIGASTGGTEALKEMLVAMPEECPPILVVQHMPEMFTKTFSKRLDSLCAIKVKEAEQNDRLMPGNAYIAPGNFHMQVANDGTWFAIKLNQSAAVNRHRPAVDVLFYSAAKCLGKNALGVILTGMGGDGAQGMKALKDAGAATFAQDEASCIVFGMPRVAIEAGGVDYIVPLNEMTGKIMAYFKDSSN